MRAQAEAVEPPEGRGPESWAGLLRGRARARAERELKFIVRAAGDSGSGCFLGLLDDGSRAWIKLPGNPQGDQVLVNETVIGAFSSLLGGPTPERRLVAVPAEMIRAWRDRPMWADRRMRLDHDVVAHASAHVEHAVEHAGDDLAHPEDDDNPARHARIIALWDLFLGGDPQWLYQPDEDHSIWSHDHGFWLFTQESDWTAEDLVRYVERAHEWDGPAACCPSELRETADRLLLIDDEQILQVLTQVPLEWGIDTGELEVLGWFIRRRIPAVAERLRDLATRAVGTGGGP